MCGGGFWTKFQDPFILFQDLLIATLTSTTEGEGAGRRIQKKKHRREGGARTGNRKPSTRARRVAIVTRGVRAGSRATRKENKGCFQSRLYTFGVKT